MRRAVCALMLLWIVPAPAAQQRSIDDFFREFSDGWVRLNPNLAVATRYFTGEEQDRLEQQITSDTDAAERQRRDYIGRGLADLARFDRASLTRWAAALGRPAALSTAGLSRLGSARGLRISARPVQRREHRPRECAVGPARHSHAEGRVELCRSSRAGRPAHGGSGRRSTAARREGSDSAALHPEPDDHADAPLRRNTGCAESVGHLARRARVGRQGTFGGRSRGARLESRGHRPQRRVSGMESRDRVPRIARVAFGRPCRPVAVRRRRGGLRALSEDVYDDEPDAGRNSRDRVASGGAPRARHGRSCSARSGDRTVRSRNASHSSRKT